MRRIWKITLGIASVPVLAVGGLGAAGQARWDRTFEATAPALRASTDPAVIARGKYLAYGPAHCASCHTRPEAWPRLDAGEEVALAGGNEFELPFGSIYTPNLTPDAETGIGRWSDGQLARMLRHGVRPDGRAALPFMEFQNLSDEDVVAVISFLRSQPAVRSEVPEHRLNALGKVLMSFVIEPIGPAGTPPATGPAEAATVERGGYLVNNVANCAGCHSKRNPMDGAYVGERLAGGQEMVRESDPAQVFVTPNLTPDPETGHIHGWSEDQFVARFRAGRQYPDSHMPWGPYTKMSDTDLRAIYRYLRSVPPVKNATGPIVQSAKQQ